MIKFTCIDSQHADIAAKQLTEHGRSCVVLARTVLANGDYDNFTAKVQHDAMAYTETPTDYDIYSLKSASK